MKKTFFVSCLASLVLLLLPVGLKANVDKDSEGLDYNSIISRYSKPSEVQRYSGDPLNEVRIHLGVGMTNSFFSIETPKISRTYVAERGIQASLGIDLLSRYWVAEGVISSYGDAQFDRTAVGLKEFELRTVYHPMKGNGWGIHFAGGLAARYLRIKSLRSGGAEENFTTPAGTLGGGLGISISDQVTFGAEAMVRTSLIDETPDMAALNLALRLDGHF